MNRWRTVSAILLVSISILASVEVYQVLAGPAPSRNSVVTPGGQTTPCTYDNYQDSGKFIGKDCTTGDNKFSESTAAQLWIDENQSNIVRFWEGGTWLVGNVAGGGTINFLSGVTDYGVYGQTVLGCNIASCIGVAVGNQNANDGNYHAFNYTIHDVTIDGGGLSTSSCFSITTALNVYVNHVIFQNCYETNTGCFRLTNWNANQILSRNVFVENSQFVKCKLTLSGIVNGYLRNSVFTGTTPGLAGQALVDFSKGDIIPTSTNNLGNFCFCGNMISGWTATAVFKGFQAISNDTIGGNTIRDAPAFLATTNTAGGIYFEGLMVKDNYYSSGTGGMAFGYGHSINILNNIISFDTSPGGGTTAITIDEAQDNQVNQEPKNIVIQNNEIYKWGGIGMVLNFTDGIVSGNQIYDVNQANGNANSNSGLLIQAFLSNTIITGNSIISDVNSGAGQSRPITYNAAAKNITITQNYLFYQAFGGAQASGINFAVAPDKTVRASDNPGYNPAGKLTNFIVAGGIGICGTSSTPVSAQAEVVCGTSIFWTCTGGTVSAIAETDFSGNQLFSVGNCAALPATGIYSPIGYKITFTFSVAPTITVFAN